MLKIVFLLSIYLNFIFFNMFDYMIFPFIAQWQVCFFLGVIKSIILNQPIWITPVVYFLMLTILNTYINYNFSLLRFFMISLSGIACDTLLNFLSHSLLFQRVLIWNMKMVYGILGSILFFLIFFYLFLRRKEL